MGDDEGGEFASSGEYMVGESVVYVGAGDRVLDADDSDMDENDIVVGVSASGDEGGVETRVNAIDPGGARIMSFGTGCWYHRLSS